MSHQPAGARPDKLSLRALRRTTSSSLLRSAGRRACRREAAVRTGEAVWYPQAGHPGRKDGRTHVGFDESRTPVEEKFSCRAADSPLAGTHAAAGLQFGVAPACVFAQGAKRNILTATNQGRFGRQLFQLWIQSGRVRQCVNKSEAPPPGQLLRL